MAMWLFSKKRQSMNYRTTNVGSARRLEGKVYVITFFVTETPWEQKEKLELFKCVRDAESWLELKAYDDNTSHTVRLWR